MLSHLALLLAACNATPQLFASMWPKDPPRSGVAAGLRSTTASERTGGTARRARRDGGLASCYNRTRATLSVLVVDRASVGSEMVETTSLSPLRIGCVATAVAPCITGPERDSNERGATGLVRSFVVAMREPTQLDGCGIGDARGA